MVVLQYNILQNVAGNEQWVFGAISIVRYIQGAILHLSAVSPTQISYVSLPFVAACNVPADRKRCLTDRKRGASESALNSSLPSCTEDRKRHVKERKRRMKGYGMEYT